MTASSLGLVVLAILAGAVISLQAPINAMASERLGHVLGGAVWSFLVGTFALGVVVALVARQDINIAAISSFGPHLYLGGLFGAIFVALSIWLTPKLGVGAVISLGIAGQILASLTMDHFGWFNLAVREVSTGRVAGAVLVVVGALLVRYF